MRIIFDRTKQSVYWPHTARGFFSEVVVAITAALAERKSLILLISPGSLVPQESANLFFKKSAFRLVDIIYNKDLHERGKKIFLLQHILYRWFLNCSPPNKSFKDLWHNDSMNLNDPDIFKSVLPELKKNLKSLIDFSEATLSSQRTLRKMGIDLERYHCVHLRAGDKLRVEAQRQSYEKYYQELIKSTEPQPVVVITDDYREYLNFNDFMIKKKYPYQMVTTASSSKTGYDQKVMMDLSVDERKNQLLDLMCDFMIAAHAHTFVGTFSSNVSRVLYVYRHGENTLGVDGDFRWIW